MKIFDHKKTDEEWDKMSFLGKKFSKFKTAIKGKILGFRIKSLKSKLGIK